MEKQSRSLFIFGDADRIRERIEGFLLYKDLEALRFLSRSLSDAIHLLAEQLAQRMEADIIVSAGDDLLAQISPDKYDKRELEALAEGFRASTGSTISFGVGTSVENAYLNLRRAKSASTDKVVDFGILS